MSTAPATAALTTWRIDPDHTQVTFAVRHMMFATVKGQFSVAAGEIRLNEADPAESSVEVSLAAASVHTNNGQRDAHLRSADFFDVDNHPDLTFVARGMEWRSGVPYRVSGDLTIRGISRTIELEVEETGRGTDPWGQEKLGFTAKTTIDRKDFGLTWNQALEAGGVLVSDEVKIVIDGQAIRL